MNHFNIDHYPQHPKILFVGLSESSHSHSWVDLLKDSKLNVRFFGLNSGVPPESWEIKTYITAQTKQKLNKNFRKRLYSKHYIYGFLKRNFAKYNHHNPYEYEERWLSNIILHWKPDIIHTLGLDPAAYFYFKVRKKYHLEDIGKWILQFRGGSDLTLNYLNPNMIPCILAILTECDQFISDNEQNFRIIKSLGIGDNKIAPISPIPGTGGVDVRKIRNNWHDLPSRRNVILLPKCYESPWSKTLPVFEALKLCWEKISPCKIIMLAMNDETKMWYWDLPSKIRNNCEIFNRIPQQDVLNIMVKTRIMLAPSLIDGIPNSMYEAMAAGAFPIVSPLSTLKPIVTDKQNVLFARNLYPNEIADAITLAMKDDELIDNAAIANFDFVQKNADRKKNQNIVTNYYWGLVEFLKDDKN